MDKEKDGPRWGTPTEPSSDAQPEAVPLSGPGAARPRPAELDGGAGELGQPRGVREARWVRFEAGAATPWQGASPGARPAATARRLAARSLVARDSAGWGLALARRTLWLAASLFAALGLALMVLIVLYRFIPPPASTLMLANRLAGVPVRSRWVALPRISPYLQLAVVMSEDAHFCRHRGVDWGELAAALEDARGGGLGRGGSTISMQVVKNLFLWPSRSLVRKAVEIPLTFVTEALWSKPRILEIYLNIAQWGPGIFGAEAAARYHFHKSAALLTPSEAALLAVSLPSPLERTPGAPGAGTVRLAHNLLVRMRAGARNVACLDTAARGAP